MSFRNSTLLTAGALSVMLALGGIAEAGHYGGYGPGKGYHGYHGGYGYHGAPIRGYGSYPGHGHPASGRNGYGHGTFGKAGEGYGKGGCGGKSKSGYMMKTAHHGAEDKAMGAPAGDIVDVAVAAGGFDTLVTAVKAAGLVETLKGPGPFTVFAPTDEAFAKIPKADLEALLADKDKLTAVLTYHVVPGKVTAAEVVGLNEAKTVQGGSVRIDASDGVMVDDAKVVKTDIMASNGVIHVIDTVIMPN